MQIPAPGTDAGNAQTGIFMMGEAGFASEHDQKVARWVVYIPAVQVTAVVVSEQYLLDLERRHFSPCAASETQERIAFTLKTGKRLRN
jgi:3-hydroxyacyl-CoA dehydrogenase